MGGRGGGDSNSRSTNRRISFFDEIGCESNVYVMYVEKLFFFFFFSRYGGDDARVRSTMAKLQEVSFEFGFSRIEGVFSPEAGGAVVGDGGGCF